MRVCAVNDSNDRLLRKVAQVLSALLAIVSVSLAVPSWTNAQSTYDHRRLLYVLDEQGHERPIETTKQWAVRRAAILAGMQAAMGPLPNRQGLERATARILRHEALDGCERLTIELTVAPGQVVPAHLYLPAGEVGQKRPAMRTAAVVS